MTKSERIPWGFIRAHGRLVATTASADRAHRAELGETAIRLLAALGISVAQLEEMIDIDEPSALLAKLQESRT